MTEDQIEAARTKVRNMLHAADHGNHLGEMAVLRMAASGELFEALKEILPAAHAYLMSGDALAQAAKKRVWMRPLERARTALSLAQPYEAEVEKADE